MTTKCKLEQSALEKLSKELIKRSTTITYESTYNTITIPHGIGNFILSRKQAYEVALSKQRAAEKWAEENYGKEFSKGWTQIYDTQGSYIQVQLIYPQKLRIADKVNETSEDFIPSFAPTTKSKLAPPALSEEEIAWNREELMYDEPFSSFRFPHKQLEEVRFLYDLNVPDGITVVHLMDSLKFLKKKFGINYKLDEDINELGLFKDGGVIVNPTKMKYDTPFHEYVHPFILAVAETNKLLYSNLIYRISELKDREPMIGEIWNSINQNYQDYTYDEKLDELLVNVLGKMSSQEFLKKMTPRDSNLLYDLWDAIVELFHAIFSKRLKVNEIPTDATLMEIAAIIASPTKISLPTFAKHPAFIRHQREATKITEEQLLNLGFLRKDTNGDIVDGIVFDKLKQEVATFQRKDWLEMAEAIKYVNSKNINLGGRKSVGYLNILKDQLENINPTSVNEYMNEFIDFLYNSKKYISYLENYWNVAKNDKKIDSQAFAILSMHIATLAKKYTDHIGAIRSILEQGYTSDNPLIEIMNSLESQARVIEANNLRIKTDYVLDKFLDLYQDQLKEFQKQIDGEIANLEEKIKTTTSQLNKATFQKKIDLLKIDRIAFEPTKENIRTLLTSTTITRDGQTFNNPFNSSLNIWNLYFEKAASGKNLASEIITQTIRDAISEYQKDQIKLQNDVTDMTNEYFSNRSKVVSDFIPRKEYNFLYDEVDEVYKENGRLVKNPDGTYATRKTLVFKTEYSNQNVVNQIAIYEDLIEEHKFDPELSDRYKNELFDYRLRNTEMYYTEEYYTLMNGFEINLNNIINDLITQNPDLADTLKNGAKSVRRYVSNIHNHLDGLKEQLLVVKNSGNKSAFAEIVREINNESLRIQRLSNEYDVDIYVEHEAQLKSEDPELIITDPERSLHVARAYKAYKEAIKEKNVYISELTPEAEAAWYKAKRLVDEKYERAKERAEAAKKEEYSKMIQDDPSLVEESDLIYYGDLPEVKDFQEVSLERDAFYQLNVKTTIPRIFYLKRQTLIDRLQSYYVMLGKPTEGTDFYWGEILKLTKGIRDNNNRLNGALLKESTQASIKNLQENLEGIRSTNKAFDSLSEFLRGALKTDEGIESINKFLDGYTVVTKQDNPADVEEIISKMVKNIFEELRELSTRQPTNYYNQAREKVFNRIYAEVLAERGFTGIKLDTAQKASIMAEVKKRFHDSEWFKNNHYLKQEFGFGEQIQVYEQTYPWTEVIPNQQEFPYQTEPGYNWRETSVNPDFKNPNYEANISSTQPKRIPANRNVSYPSDTRKINFLNQLREYYLNNQSKNNQDRLDLKLPYSHKRGSERTVELVASLTNGGLKTTVGKFRDTARGAWQLVSNDDEESMYYKGNQTIDYDAKKKLYLPFRSYLSLEERSYDIPRLVLSFLDATAKHTHMKGIKLSVETGIDLMQESKMDSGAIKAARAYADAELYGERFVSGDAGRAITIFMSVLKKLVSTSSRLLLLASAKAALKNYLGSYAQMGTLYNTYGISVREFKLAQTEALNILKLDSANQATGKRSIPIQIAQYFNVSQENYGDRNFNISKSNLSKYNPLSRINILRDFSEDIIAHTAYVALGKTFLVKAPNGRMVPIYEAYTVKDNEVQIKEGYDVSTKDEKTFRNKLEEFIQSTTGNYKDSTSVLAKRTWWGSILAPLTIGFFPSMFSKGFKRRRSHLGANIIEEGYKTTMYRFFADLFTPKGRARIQTYNEAQKQNLLSSAKYNILYWSLASLLFMLSKADWDDEEDGPLLYLYMSLRDLVDEVETFHAVGSPREVAHAFVFEKAGGKNWIDKSFYTLYGAPFETLDLNLLDKDLYSFKPFLSLKDRKLRPDEGEVDYSDFENTRPFEKGKPGLLVLLNRVTGIRNLATLFSKDDVAYTIKQQKTYRPKTYELSYVEPTPSRISSYASKVLKSQRFSDVKDPRKASLAEKLLFFNPQFSYYTEEDILRASIEKARREGTYDEIVKKEKDKTKKSRRESSRLKKEREEIKRDILK